MATASAASGRLVAKPQTVKTVQFLEIPGIPPAGTPFAEGGASPVYAHGGIMRSEHVAIVWC